PSGDGDDEEAEDGTEGSDASRLAVRLTYADSICGGRGVFRGAGAKSRTRVTQGAGQGRMAQFISAGAISFRGRFRAGRSVPEQGGCVKGPNNQNGRPVDRAIATRRAAHHYQLHRSPVAHAARRVRRGLGSAK